MNIWGLTFSALGVTISAASILWTYLVPHMLPKVEEVLPEDYKTIKGCFAVAGPAVTVIGLCLMADDWGRYVGPLGLGFGIAIVVSLVVVVLLKLRLRRADG